MQKVRRVSQIGWDGFARELLFALVPAAAGAQALGFEAQKGPQSAADVVALGFLYPAALLQAPVVLLDAPG